MESSPRAAGISGWTASQATASTFTIYLPRVDAAENPSSADDLLAQAPHGDATILLVEDEPLLRDLAGRVLRRYGYHVLEADDGPTALRVPPHIRERLTCC